MNKKTIVLLILTALLSACGGGDDTSKIPSVIQPSDDPTLTDEQNVDVPESEVIFQKASDGYTYNEPQPIQDDWIIEPATDDHPATIDESKLSSSWYIPSNYTEFQKVIQTGEFSYLGVSSNIEAGAHISLIENTTKKDFFNYIEDILDIEYVISDSFEDKDKFNIYFINSTSEKILLEKKKLIHSKQRGKMFSYSNINPIFSVLNPDFKDNDDYVNKFNQLKEKSFEGK